MGFYHTFNAVGDQFARGKAVMHTVVPHGKSVADGNGVELHRRAAGRKNAVFDRAGDLLQVDVSGNDFIETVDDTYKRFGHLFSGLAQRAQ